MLPKGTYDVEVPLHQNTNSKYAFVKTNCQKLPKKNTHNTLFPSQRSEPKGAFGWVDFRDERKWKRKFLFLFLVFGWVDFKEGKLAGLRYFLLKPTKMLSSQFMEKINRRRVVVVK